MKTPDTPLDAPVMTPPGDTPVMPPSVMGLSEAARVCGVSVATMRRRRDILRKNGAVETSQGWQITPAVLMAAGLLEGPSLVPPDGPVTGGDDAPSDTPRDAPVDSPPDAPSDAEVRAAVAEARVELLERERADLLRRAEQAEATAREATATAAALALAVKQIERAGGSGTPPAATEAGEHVTRDISEGEVPVSGGVWGAAKRFLRGHPKA